jgi:hypothetical protein
MPISAQTNLSLVCQILHNEPRATASEVALFFDIAQASGELTIGEEIHSRREGNVVNYTKINITLALVISCGLSAFAQTPEFNIVKPSTTGCRVKKCV